MPISISFLKRLIIKTIVQQSARVILTRSFFYILQIDSDWNEHNDGIIFFMSVDGTHCPIEEPHPFSKKWSSHKFGGKPGLNYEIGLKIDEQESAVGLRS
jgi:hypothetical protein